MAVATLISIQNTGDLKMRALFNGKPTLEEIYAAQCKAGYQANGYPARISYDEVENPAHVVAGEIIVVNFQLQAPKDLN